MQYAVTVMGFLPETLAEIFAAIATAAEILFGALLLAGKWTRKVSLGSGILTLLFGVSMAISFGIVSPLSYSVFVVSAASFLLATIDRYRWSLDNK